MRKVKTNNFLVAGIILLVVVALFFVFRNSVENAVLGSNVVVKLALPHYGSFECKAYPDKVGQVVNVPAGGSLLSSSTVGFYTDGIKNIKLTFVSSKWSITTWAVRVGYSVCDKNGNNCGAYQYVTDYVGGTRYLPVNSVDFNYQSLRVVFERKPIIGGWAGVEGLQVSYDATPYELVYHSTLGDPAGAVVCSTSCDLTCPSIGVRDKLIFVQDNILGFGQTAPAFEYWESIDYNLNMQGGATVYNATSNQFCFSGTIYSGKSTLTQNGVTYVYPDVNTKQSKLCCPNARISSTYSDKVCQSDYTWKVVADTDKLSCFGDATCPNAGNSICQNKILSAGYSCVDKDTNGVGICQKAVGKAVACCLNSDCNKDMVCDLSSHTCKGGSILPVCGDNVVESGEQCDDGNTKGGDGCSSTCQKETLFVCGNNIVESGEQCDDGNTKSNDGCSSTCQKDNLTCSWYQESYTQSEVSYGLLGWRHLFNNPVTLNVSGCKTAGWVIVVIIAVFVSALIVFLVLTYLPSPAIKKIMPKRGRRRK